MLELIFGLALFLLAMLELETSISNASGRRFSKWITEHTDTGLSSVGAGVILTAILQSSSMVSLLTLAFVSASVIPLFNGIGVVLGANLGTTLTGWLVTIIGFKLDLDTLVVPLLGLGALVQIIWSKHDTVRSSGRALFALGLLIYGLNVMKGSVAGLADANILDQLSGMPTWAYLLSGVLLASIMQSSSAVMLLTLSLISTDVLAIVPAVALIIGADLGTTSTTVLGSLGQSTVKKQLALAHVLFNVIVNTSAYFLLLPVLPGLLDWLGLSDKMFALVGFHSLFNLLGILVFLPFLHQYTAWIQTLLKQPDDLLAAVFDVPTSVPDAAINAMRNAVNQACMDAYKNHLDEFKISPHDIGWNPKQLRLSEGSFEHRYLLLKKFENRLNRYARELRLNALSVSQDDEVAYLLERVRGIVYASKLLKDSRSDLELMRTMTDGDELSEELSHRHKTYLTEILRQLLPNVIDGANESLEIGDVLKQLERNGHHYEAVDKLVTQRLDDLSSQDAPISTFYNLNHKLHDYVISLIEILRSSRVASTA